MYETHAKILVHPTQKVNDLPNFWKAEDHGWVPAINYEIWREGDELFARFMTPFVVEGLIHPTNGNELSHMLNTYWYYLLGVGTEVLEWNEGIHPFRWDDPRYPQ